METKTICCLDCMNFRYNKHMEAFCKMGMITKHNGEEMYFKDFTTSYGKRKQFSLINRGREMKHLNPKKCMFFDDMR